MIRNNWTKEEIAKIHNRPLLDLIYEAATIHRENNDYSEVQISSLISIKTGGCSEDCSYCPQAARYHTGVDVHALMQVDEVIDTAQKAKQGGASRLCMGAAWREVRDNRDFDRVIEMVKAVNAMDMEVSEDIHLIAFHTIKKEVMKRLMNSNASMGEVYDERVK